MKKFFLILLASFSTSGFAANCFSLSSSAITYTVGETNPPATNNIQITRTNNSANCDEYFLGFSDGGASNYNRRVINSANGTTLSYNLYKFSDGSGILKDKPSITSNSETFFGPIARDQSIVSSFYFILGSISASTPPRSGTYTDTVQLSDYHGTWNGVSTQDDIVNMLVTVNVPPVTNLSLIPTGGVYDSTQTSRILNFGTLEDSEELGFDIKIVSNAGYDLKVSSANNGKLKNLVASGTNALIDYEFYASNTLRSLLTSANTPVSVGTGTGLTPAGGATIPIRVKIGSTANKIEGDYEDVITVTVVSTN